MSELKVYVPQDGPYGLVPEEGGERIMKCDELKPLVFSLKDLAYIDEPAAQKNFENPHEHAVYKATEVDAAIAELKQKLEDAKATAYTESVDAGMRERKLKRALWLARAEMARFLAMIIDQHPYTQVLHFTSRKRDDSGKPLGIARTAMEWWRMFKEVERKCLKKSEQYK